MKRNKLFFIWRMLVATLVVSALWTLFAARVTQASGFSQPTAGTWTYTGSLSVARIGHTATQLQDGRILVAGGSAPDEIGSAEIYDPVTETWSPTGSLNIARYAHTATLLPDGKVIVAGGGCLSPCTSPGASAELYDPLTGVWTSTGNLNVARTQHTATLLPDGKLLVAGGCSSAACASAELFDPGTGAWTTTGSLITGRARHTAALLSNGKVLVVGGSSSTAVLKSTELFNPATGTWSATGSMKTARADHQATVLQNGMLLVTGGCSTGNCSTILKSTELYNVATGKWAYTGMMINIRGWGHTATLLPDGDVLVAGGCKVGRCSAYDSTAELYNPGTGDWSLTGELNEVRFSHTATLLTDSRVLVAAGCGNPPCTRLFSAELYATLP